jgi:TonB family protein
MPHDVFISYSAKDKITADAVCAVLESGGIRCWIAPRDVLPSMEWGEAIIDAIEECRMMVLVFTANANASPQIRREVERAVNHGVPILPIRIEDVLPGKGLEYFIGNVHWLDALTPPLEAHLKNLAGTIKIVLARTELGAPPKPLGEEKPLPGAGHRSEERTPEKGSGRGGESAPRRFWSTRAWTWAAGTVSAVLLGAVFVEVHFASHSAPAASPEPVTSPDDAPNPASMPLPATGPAGPATSPLPAPAATPVAPRTAKTGGVPRAPPPQPEAAPAPEQGAPGNAGSSGAAAPTKVKISAGMAASMLIERTPPSYPPIAEAARVQGTVVLRATISKEGTIKNLEVVSGPAMLQQASLDAVRAWRYRPYLLNNEPVEVETTINVIFTLGE